VIYIQSLLMAMIIAGIPAGFLCLIVSMDSHLYKTPLQHYGWIWIGWLIASAILFACTIWPDLIVALMLVIVLIAVFGA